jgi:hypothetical protein
MILFATRVGCGGDVVYQLCAIVMMGSRLREHFVLVLTRSVNRTLFERSRHHEVVDRSRNRSENIVRIPYSQELPHRSLHALAPRSTTSALASVALEIGRGPV